MTWSRFDDAAATHPKARRAGNDAWALWAAAVMYCNRYNTDGFVTLAALAVECLPHPIPMRRAKKLSETLCEAAARPDGGGLFERTEHGYRVHDFLDWNESRDRVQLRREIDRVRKVNQELRGAVIARDGMVCGICGDVIEAGHEVHIDHRLPVSKGGPTTLENLQVAHASCNIRKGART